MSENQEQFERLFDSCYRPVHAYAVRRVPADTVQDVVSETFLIAWRRGEELERERDPLPWLFGVARRVAANQLRGDSRREALQTRLRSEHEPAAAASCGDSSLIQALAQLAEADREALLLTAWEGLDHRAAARAMGCSTGAFTVRLHRARKRLARSLAEHKPQAIDVPHEVRSAR